MARYEIDERIGCAAILDTNHDFYINERNNGYANGLHSDNPDVVYYVTYPNQWTDQSTISVMKYESSMESLNKRLDELNIEIPKRTKVEYVKVTDSIFDLRADFEAGELYFAWVGNGREGIGYDKITEESMLLCRYEEGRLLRKVEREVDFDSVLCDFGGRTDGESVHISPTWSKESLILFCHEMAEVTDKPQ